METGLVVPLTMSQIEAANRLHGKLLQWQVTDRALYIIQVNLPRFDIEATLLKVVTVNQLYGTNVYAVVRMAQQINAEVAEMFKSPSPEVITELAILSPCNEEKAL